MFEIYKNKKVFITGNTGFKGSWLASILQKLNVQITGFSIAPQTNPNHFILLSADYKTTIGNILDKEKLEMALLEAQPHIIFHLAAQAIVRKSFLEPVNTYQTNIIGTLNLLEAARKCKSVTSVVIITTDKVYENKEWEKAYAETDELGGYDMYSSSKACCEILVKSYRSSFLNTAEYKKSHNILIASARAGNVIGGGDWNADRLIPDICIAASKKNTVQIRNPKSVRPWQHVLDCLHGYLLLGARLLSEETKFAAAWNFAPPISETKTVEEITDIAKAEWRNIEVEFSTAQQTFYETKLLTLDNTKAIEELKWKPVWDTITSVQKTIEWYKIYYTENKILTGDHICGFLNDIGHF